MCSICAQGVNFPRWGISLVPLYHLTMNNSLVLFPVEIERYLAVVLFPVEESLTTRGQ